MAAFDAHEPPTLQQLHNSLESAIFNYREASIRLRRAEDALAEALPLSSYPPREQEAEMEERRLRVAEEFRAKLQSIEEQFEELDRLAAEEFK